MTLPTIPNNIPIPAITMPPVGGAPSSPGGGAFQSVLSEAITRVESFQQNADASVGRFLSGEGEELHHVAIAGQQAELSFQLFMQVRNKVTAAYQQVMQMQV